jgi:hypothetical protein
MFARSSLFVALLCLTLWSFTTCPAAAADPPDLTGLWYGTWEVAEYANWTSNFSIVFWESPDGLLATLDAPEMGLFGDPLYDTLPALVMPVSGGFGLLIGVPGVVEISGVIDDDSVSGSFYVSFGGPAPVAYTGIWQAQRFTEAVPLPDEAPGTVCDSLPPLYTPGPAEWSSELVFFEPSEGVGYADYPDYPETAEDQLFSYIRRDLMRVVKYATAKVVCKTADWEYGNHAPIGLGDMSEADGATPGTSLGFLRHPAGTHDNGRDIDTGYYQLYAADNRCYRPVGPHYDGFEDMLHCVDEPYALDVWRNALYVAYLSQHPRVRVIGVDGLVGLLLEDALDDLVDLGWIDAELRESIPLAYELEDNGWGWYRFHHHHLHISMSPVYDFVAIAELTPPKLNRHSEGKWVTAHVELDDVGLDAFDIDEGSVALILDGHTMLNCEPDHWDIADFNQNGTPDLTVKFDRQTLIETLGQGWSEVTLTGSAQGWFFQETDTIRVQSGK